MISQFWSRIQYSLFPFLKEELGVLTEMQQKLVAILEFARIEEFIRVYCGEVGRPQDNRQSIARAFIAKAVYNMNTTRMLIERLKSDITLRRICGWEQQSDIPEEWTFSRAFREFSDSELPSRVHEALIAKFEGERIVGHIARDATEIEGRERPAKKESATEQLPVEQLPEKKKGRPPKGMEKPKEPTRMEKQQMMTLDEMILALPNQCDVGTKMNSKGYKESWVGYKLHIDSADGDIPISCILTSASVHDSQVALPLMGMTSQRVNSFYDLMDAAYDSEIIKNRCIELGHIPIIDSNPRRGEKIEMDPAKAVRYNNRTIAERVNSRLKDSFGGRSVRVQGPSKVLAHLMFGILALTADQLIRLVS